MEIIKEGTLIQILTRLQTQALLSILLSTKTSGLAMPWPHNWNNTNQRPETSIIDFFVGVQAENIGR